MTTTSGSALPSNTLMDCLHWQAFWDNLLFNPAQVRTTATGRPFQTEMYSPQWVSLTHPLYFRATFWFQAQSHVPLSCQTPFSQSSQLWKLRPPHWKQELVSPRSSTVSLRSTTKDQTWPSSGTRNSTERDANCLAIQAGRGTLRGGVLTSRASQAEMPPIPSPIPRQPVKGRTFVQSLFHRCLPAWT